MWFLKVPKNSKKTSSLVLYFPHELKSVIGIQKYLKLQKLKIWNLTPELSEIFPKLTHLGASARIYGPDGFMSLTDLGPKIYENEDSEIYENEDSEI